MRDCKSGGVRIFFSASRGRRKTGSAPCYCVLYVTVTLADMKCHEQKGKSRERTNCSNGLRGLEFGGLWKRW
jgi:hypothetical protein